MTAQVVAVDVGNSTVGLSVRDADEVRSRNVSLRDADWATICQEWVHRKSQEARTLWIIASVHSTACDQIVQTLSHDDRNDIHVVTGADVPMPVLVDAPEKLGIDRLLAAHAASLEFEPPFAVVDIGSAITVDWVDNQRRFCGGAILPGLSLQSAALHRWTDALPDLSDQWNLLDPRNDNALQLRLPGRNTEEAIRGGILGGACGAIDALVREYAGPNAEPPPSVAVTGGQAALIAPRMGQNYHLLTNLVCRGLLELPRSREYLESESRTL